VFLHRLIQKLGADLLMLTDDPFYFCTILRHRFSTLVETVSRKPTPPHVKAFTVEVVCYDRDGEDVEVPYVLVKFA